MPYTPRRLFNPTALGSVLTMFTVPAGSTDILKQLVAANTSDADIRLFVSLVVSGGASGNANRLIPGSIIPPRSTVTFDFSQVFNPGDSLTARVEGVNLLLANDASFETDVTGWAARANAVIARSTAQAAHGVASMRLSSTSASTVTLLADTIIKLGVTRGRRYSAKAVFRADGTARSSRIHIDWLREDLSFISTTSSVAYNDLLTAFREIAITALPPAEAAFVNIAVEIAGVAVNGEGHFIDKVQFAEGEAFTPWVDPSNPGLVLTGSGVRLS